MNAIYASITFSIEEGITSPAPTSLGFKLHCVHIVHQRTKKVKQYKDNTNLCYSLNVKINF